MRLRNYSKEGIQTTGYVSEAELLKRKRKLMTYRNIVLLILACVLGMQNYSLVQENKKLQATNAELVKHVGELNVVVQDSKEQIVTLEKKVASMSNELNALKELVARLDNAPFDLADLTKPSNATADKLNNKFYGTGLQGKGAEFIKAEKEKGVNAYFLASLACWESDYGRSAKAKRLKNYYGIDCTEERKGNTAGRGFTSFESSTQYVAGLLKEKYLTQGGEFYNGTGLSDINKRYAVYGDGSVNKEWSKGIRQLMKELASQ